MSRGGEAACLPMPPPEAVVFDLGGVLVDWNPRHLYRKLFADAAAMEAFLARICTPLWHERHDRGTPFAENRTRLIARFPDHEALIAAWDARWPEMFADPLPGSADLLAALDARGLPLYAFTNWPAEKFPLAREMFPFLARFCDIVVSGEEGLSKPEPRLFTRLIARCGLVPARTLYIDDNPINIAAARARGFLAHHFRDPPGLRAALVGCGLLAEAETGAL